MIVGEVSVEHLKCCHSIGLWKGRGGEQWPGPAVIAGVGAAAGWKTGEKWKGLVADFRWHPALLVVLTG